MEILAEAATQGTFTTDARRRLEQLYATVTANVPERVTDTLDVLIHDGYLEQAAGGHGFCSRLLRDWWASRFRDSHKPLESRPVGGQLGNQTG